MVQLDSVGSTLLKAAGDLLAAEGPGALTVRRIAHAAGVSTMNVYSRFGGKLKEVGPPVIDWPEVYQEAMRMIIKGLA